MVSKVDAASGITWSTYYTPPGTVGKFGAFAMDQFGESYVVGLCSAMGVAPFSHCLIKISGVGGLRFHAEYNFAGGIYQMPGLAIHPASGDIFSCGTDMGNFSSKQLGIIYRQAPLAIADGYITHVNTPFSSMNTLTTNDRQWQGAVCSLAQNVSHGMLTLNSNATFTYTPTMGYTGNDTFKYTLTKPNLSSSTAQVTIQVLP